MKTDKKKVVIFSAAAVIIGFIMHFIPEFMFVTVDQMSHLQYILLETVRFILSYGSVLIFGFLCYGKDKRVLHFVFGFAFGCQVGKALTLSVMDIVSDLLSVVFYIDPVYRTNISVVGGIASALLVLLIFNRQGGCLYTRKVEAENEAHRKNMSPTKAIALICVVSFVCLRVVGYLIIMKGAPLTFDLGGELSYLGGHIADLLVTITAFGLCYLISNMFAENKKAALYCVGFFCFVYSISYVASSVITDAFHIFAYTDSLSYVATVLIFRVGIVALGDIFAVLVAVMLCRFLTGSEKKKSSVEK